MENVGEALADVQHISNADRHPATEEQLAGLREFIGDFKEWLGMNDDAKSHVVSMLEQPDMMNLSMCSKAEHGLVDSATARNVTKITVSDCDGNRPGEYENRKQVLVEIGFDRHEQDGEIYPKTVLSLTFSQLAEHTTRVEQKWSAFRNEPRNGFAAKVSERVIENSGDYYEEAVKVVEKWMKKACYKIGGLDLEMLNYPIEMSSIKSLPECRHARLKLGTADAFNWWLHKLPEQMTSLNISLLLDPIPVPRKWVIVPATFHRDAHLLNAARLRIEGAVGFDCDGLMALKASRFSVHVSWLRSAWINAFLRRWARGEGVPGFTHATFYPLPWLKPHRIHRGLVWVPWSSRLIRLQPEFYASLTRRDPEAQCFQVRSDANPLESMTVMFCIDSLHIIATGNEATRHDGSRYMEYRVPPEPTIESWF